MNLPYNEAMSIFSSVVIPLLRAGIMGNDATFMERRVPGTGTADFWSIVVI